jgi:deoxyribodipyrimidine photolyase
MCYTQSNLSPYLHFGRISAQSVALAVMARKRKSDAFLEEPEELIV